jgi:Subtilisin-like serine proteases
MLDDFVADPVESIAKQLASAHGGTVLCIYRNTIKGFAVRMPDAAAVALANHPLVVSVEENPVISIASAQALVPTQPNLAGMWYLDRIDQLNKTAPKMNNSFYYCSLGCGVRAYVVDTGVLPNHKELIGRVEQAQGLAQLLIDHGLGLSPQCWTYYMNSFSPSASHGTAVASLIGGSTFGVAKGVTLVDTRAFDCGGGSTGARVNLALDWIEADPNRGSAPSVVNLSFQFMTYEPDVQMMKTIINRLVDQDNIKVVAAAGNGGDDTWWITPANAARAITVAGSTQITDSAGTDAHFAFSNYRAHIYAPAQLVESASTQVTETGFTRDYKRSELDGCDTGYQYKCTSGTSFAAPLVTGAIARYLQSHQSASRDAVLSYLQNESATGNGVIIRYSGSFPAPLLNISDYTGQGSCP